MPVSTSSSSSTSRHEATATMTLLQALYQFKRAFPQLPDEDFLEGVLNILPSHFEKVIEVWYQACDQFKTLDNLMRLVDGVAHALAVSSGDHGGDDHKKDSKQVDSKEILKKLEDFLSSGAIRRTKTETLSSPAGPELVDLTSDDKETDVKPKPKKEVGEDLKQIFARDTKPLEEVRIKLKREGGDHQLKKAKFSLPPPPPPPLSSSVSLDPLQPNTSGAVSLTRHVMTNMLSRVSRSNPWEAIDKLSSPSTTTSGRKGPINSVMQSKHPVNGLRLVEFEILSEEYSIVRRHEYLHEYKQLGPTILKLRSGPIEAHGFGYIYSVKYGDFMAFHVPNWRIDGISYKTMKKGLRRPIDKEGFARLFKNIMEQPEPRSLPLEVRLNEFGWDQKQASSSSEWHQQPKSL